MRNLILILLCVLVVTGCSIQKEPQNEDLVSAMAGVVSYELNTVEEEHVEKLNQWLANARETGEVGQYFIYQDGTNKEDMYSYVYRKGYTDFEVSFIYNPGDPNLKGEIHVTGINKEMQSDNYVQIKSINYLSILFVLSEESLKSKLNESKFEVGNDELKNIQVNEPFQITGYLRNISNQNLEISYGAGLFTYEIYDSDGKIVQRKDGMLFKNDIGYVAEVKSKAEYRDNGEGQRSKEYYEFKINELGTYRLKTKAEFRIKNEEEYKGFEIISDDLYEFIVK